MMERWSILSAGTATTGPATMAGGHSHRGPFWLRHRGGNGGPLRRDPADRLGGGVAAGVAAWRGFNVTTVRIVFVLIALVSGGWFVPVYVAGWLFLPAAGEQASIGSKARSDSRGIRLAIGLSSLLILVLLAVSALNGGWFVGWAWPQVFSVAGLVLIWRNAPQEEQATLRRLLEPFETAADSSAGASGRRFAWCSRALCSSAAWAGCSRLTRAWPCCGRSAGWCW